MLQTCYFAVASLMPRITAMSGLLLPSATTPLPLESYRHRMAQPAALPNAARPLPLAHGACRGPGERAGMTVPADELTTPPHFAAELRAILEAELAAGNSIAEVRPGGALHESLVVILARPFLTPLRPATANLRFRQVNLPGWWRTEYTAAVTPHTLACW